MAAAKFNEIAPGQAALKQKQGSLQFIAGPDASQVSSPIQLFDVQVDCDADPWAGLDLIWTNLPTTIPALLGRELADGRLGIRSDAQFGRSLVATRTVKDGEVICLCHGMRFTDIHKVQDFLQQKGNSRFADRIVRVGNVAKDGEKVDVHVVLMGAAGYINHYLGIRRFPNSVIEMDCASGPASGFLKIVCQTATGQGIAGGGPIVLNYGPHYDLTQKPHEEEAPFLGGLDSFFQKLDAGMTKNEPEQVTPQKRQGEPESSRTPPNPDAKKAKTEAKAEATVQETPKKEATVQVEKPKAESSGAPAGSSPPLVELGECNGLKVGLQVSENGPSTLHVFNTDTKNKRMSKGTVFCKWTDGNVVRGVELPANGVEYALQPSSWVLHESLQYIQVQDAIKKEPACSCLFGYEPFPCATPPKVLKPAKAGKMIVVCKDAQTVQVHRAPSDALRLVFIMKMQKETMLPHGLALVCSKQITVPAGQWKQV